MNKREIIKDLLNGNPKEKEAAIQELKNSTTHFKTHVL